MRATRRLLQALQLGALACPVLSGAALPARIGQREEARRAPPLPRRPAGRRRRRPRTCPAPPPAARGAAPHLPRERHREGAVLRARRPGLLTLADDSGLEVDALGGLPGSRQRVLRGPPVGRRGEQPEAPRRASRRSAARAAPRATAARSRSLSPTASSSRRDAACEGRIAESRAGAEGFGYDPLFLVGSGPLSFGQIDPATKDRISHRGKALAKLRAALPGDPRGERDWLHMVQRHLENWLWLVPMVALAGAGAAASSAVLLGGRGQPSSTSLGALADRRRT